MTASTYSRMTAYERAELQKIREWKAPSEGGVLAWMGRAVSKPFEVADQAVRKIPGAAIILDKTLIGMMGLVNDMAQWSVRPEAIYEEFETSGPPIRCAADIQMLSLEDVDRAIGYLDAKYKALAAAEGVASGMAGAPGIPVDLVALTALNLRAVGEYAVYCGFDPNTQQERMYALNVLGCSSAGSEVATRTATLASLNKLALDVARKKSWDELSKNAFVKMLQAIAKQLGIRLTKQKLAQVIPVLGGAVGGGYNAYFTSKTCEAAFYLYRERFLAAKYGPEILEV